VTKPREEFISMMKTEFVRFAAHIERVSSQYQGVKTMKEKLPKGHVLIQMDFSENYTCSTLEEIQSAYWNSSMVTLHPEVIYYRDDNDELCHKSFVHVSEVLNHNDTMVLTIIDRLVKIVKEIGHEVQWIHFWTDSPSSQYRNKTIFDTVGRFPEIYGMFASWHYFESGHGKGPCDGIGGTAKRNADNAVKQGKSLIQDARDFFAWASANQQGIQYDFITEHEYENKKLTSESKQSNH